MRYGRDQTDVFSSIRRPSGFAKASLNRATFCARRQPEEQGGLLEHDRVRRRARRLANRRRGHLPSASAQIPESAGLLGSTACCLAPTMTMNSPCRSRGNLLVASVAGRRGSSAHLAGSATSGV